MVNSDFRHGVKFGNACVNYSVQNLMFDLDAIILEATGFGSFRQI
jgi:hypothetical protein